LYTIDFKITDSYGYELKDGNIKILRNKKLEQTKIDENGEGSLSVPPGGYEIIVSSENGEIAKQNIEIRGDKIVNILTKEESDLHKIVTFLGIILAIFAVIFMIWKKRYYEGIKLLAIALLIISLVSPWWVLSGETNNIETTTKTLLVPSNVVTLTTSSDIIGGDISQLPEEVSMILGLLSVLIIIICLFSLVTIFIKNKFRKTSFVLSILCNIILILILVIFFYIMALLTDVSVGGFFGSGDIETSIPGVAEPLLISSSWGPGVGFYLTISAVILLISWIFLQKKVKNKKE
jgi:hypothetical protein